MNKIIWMVDSGHGGMIDNIYQTSPKKMYRHSDTEVFHEGVFNRQIRDKLINRGEAKGFKMIDICPTELDIPLSVRVDIINAYYKIYKNAVLLSLHSNAGGGTGFEIWTSYGQTKSDKFAELLGEELQDSFPSIRFRTDTSDGDIDKEAAFYILKWSSCPAILPECLFFDNYEDYKKLIDPDFQTRYVDALVNFMLKAELVL